MAHAVSGTSSSNEPSLVFSPPPSPAKKAEEKALPRTPPRQGALASLFDSPAHVKSPMKYHYYDQLPLAKRRDLRGFPKKAQHSIAPDSAEKQVRVIQRNYDEIRKIRKLKLEEADVSYTRLFDEEDPDAEIVVLSKMEVQVKQDGRERTFGIHETVTKEQKKQYRLYPKEGTGIVRASGPEVLDLIEDYKQKQAATSFQEFVIASAKDGEKSL
ncbi:MAG: hypothetical protein JSR39_02360 [Verrucomicrobia bacterium]|nr:hypothetical protein [Verrucomicrobiota bacterium]